MHVKSQMKPFLSAMIASFAALVLIAAAVAGSPQKKGAKAQPSKVVPKATQFKPGIDNVVYTPVSLATDKPSITPDGNIEPTLTSDFELVNVMLVRAKGHLTLRVTKTTATKPTIAATSEEFFLQVYRVTFDAGQGKSRLTAITAPRFRQLWKYYDKDNHLQPWPDKGILVDFPGPTKIKVRYVGGNSNPKNVNFVFVVSDGNDPTDTLFASTVVHLKQ